MKEEWRIEELRKQEDQTSPNRSVYAASLRSLAPGCACSTTFMFCATALRPTFVYGVDLVDSTKQGAHGVRPGWAHPTSYTAGTLGDI